uniref:RNA recognition motif domain containing protein n=1 Tax=Haemonchus contortus TaxID=6289 RepID=W6NX28_HAECO
MVNMEDETNNPTADEVKDELLDEQQQDEGEGKEQTEENGQEKNDNDQEKDETTQEESSKDSVDGKKLPQTNYVRLRGLPYSAKESDIRDFFEGIEVTTITMSSSHNGRPSGECYCELPSNKDALKALDLHRKEMEGRYIEVFTVSSDELTNLKRVGIVSDDGKVIRCRGLPFSATTQDVKDFFKGLTCEEVVFGRTGGRPSGEAFVRLASREEAVKALDFNKQHMGSRYVEVFRTTVDDMERNRPRNYDGGYIRPLFDSRDYISRSPRGMRGMRSAPYDIPRGGYGRYDDYDDFVPPTKVFMRGLPFDADAFMIEQFFAPLRCIEISLGFNEDRRPSGDAVVEFGTTAEAHEAFSRNKAMMGKRYVELFGSNDMPHTMRRLTWRVVGGQPAPRPLALVPPRDLGYGDMGYGGYGGMRGGGGYGRGYEPGPGPFRGYGGGGLGGGGPRSRDRRSGVW